MVKARAKLGDGSPMLIFGLSDENMRRLPAEAITFDLGELCAGMTPEDLAQAKVMIMTGPTEDAIAAALNSGLVLMDPEGSA